ncbi:hypothetical protein CRG98_021127, partial [Punica granatum]
TPQCCKRHERSGSAILRCKKLNSHGLTVPAGLKESRARWLGELAVQESKLEGLSDPARWLVARARWRGELAMHESKLARTQQSCKRHERSGTASLRCKKVNSHELADRTRLQEARARWLGELKVHETNPARLQEARARWLGELAVQESKLARISRPGKVTRSTREVAQRTCGARKKVNSQGLADPGRLQEARARWLGELAVMESKLARVSRPGKVARGTSEVARRTCDAGKKTRTEPARLQEARVRCLGELAVQEIKLSRVSRPGKVARGTREVPQLTCGAGKYSRTGSGPGKTGKGCKMQEGGGSANFRCQKLNSHGLADPAKLQEARAKWLGELAMQESKLARVSRPGKVARGTSDVARRTCGDGKHERGGLANLRCRKVSFHGLADPGRLQEARARWLGELAVQESKLSRVSRPGKVARCKREVARPTFGARN